MFLKFIDILINNVYNTIFKLSIYLIYYSRITTDSFYYIEWDTQVSLTINNRINFNYFLKLVSAKLINFNYFESILLY